MVCSKCNQQMYQSVSKGKPIGWGISSDNRYETEELKECKCGNLVIERYQATQVTPDEAAKYIKYILEKEVTK